MSLLPEDNLLANVWHVDVALVIMRAAWDGEGGQINETGHCAEGQLANANNLIEILHKAFFWFGTKTITAQTQTAFWTETKAICWESKRLFFTFRCECVVLAAIAFSILIGCGQHIPVAWILLTGHRSSRRRQHKHVYIFVLNSNILLVLSGLLLVSVPPLLAMLCVLPPPLWSRAISTSSLHWWRCQSL